ncbi:MAG: hypothetical protein ACPG7R_00915, partial [Planctomycetota bacterium]
MLANLRFHLIFASVITSCVLTSADLSAQCGGAIQLQPTQPVRGVVIGQPLVPGSIIPPNIILGEDGEVLMLAEDPAVVMETKAEGESASADAQSFKDAVAQMSLPPKTVDKVIQARQKMLLDPPVKPAEDAEVGEKIAYLTQLITASDWQGVASVISAEADCESCFDQVIGHLAARDESVT